jgi:hypothetical protein
MTLGKACWRVEFSHGDELDLDLGQRLLRTGGPLRDKSYGEYQLCILSDDWVLSDPSGQTLASGTTLAAYELDDHDASAETLANYERERKDLLAQLSAIVDQTVASIDVNGPQLGLGVTFANSLTLTVSCEGRPDPIDRPESGGGDESIACWELYLPDKRLVDMSRERVVPDWPLIKVVPGGLWSVTSWGGP